MIVHPIKCILLPCKTKKVSCKRNKRLYKFCNYSKTKNKIYRVCTANFVGRNRRDGALSYLFWCVSLQHTRLMTYMVTRKPIIHAILKLTKYKIHYAIYN